LLRSENERTRHDSVIALYHLSLVKSNRVRLVKLGSIPVLLGMVKPGHMPDITKLQSYFAELQSFISQVQPFTCLLSKQPKDDSIQSDISKLQSNVTDLLTYVTIVFTTKSLVQPNEPVQYLWRT